MKILIDIPAEEYRWICKSDETWAANVASKECMMNAIKRGVVISKITNGDVIKTMFPNASIEIRNISVYVDMGNIVGFSRSWWDAPYKQEDSDEETETR